MASKMQRYQPIMVLSELMNGGGREVPANSSPGLPPSPPPNSHQSPPPFHQQAAPASSFPSSPTSGPGPPPTPTTGSELLRQSPGPGPPPTPVVGCNPALAALLGGNSFPNACAPATGQQGSSRIFPSPPRYFPLMAASNATPLMHPSIPSLSDPNCHDHKPDTEADAALARMLHEEELGSVHVDQERARQLQQQQLLEDMKRQQQQQQQQQQQGDQSNGDDDHADLLALLGTPAEIYEAQYGCFAESDLPTTTTTTTSHEQMPLSPASPTSPLTPNTAHAAPTDHHNGVDAALLGALAGNPSEAYQYLYSTGAPIACAGTAAAAAGAKEACVELASGARSPSSLTSGTSATAVTPDLRSCPASPSPAQAVAAAPPEASKRVQACPHALAALGVSEEEVQQALLAEQQLMHSKAQDGGYQQELATLAQFFPAVPQAELLAVLEAFKGDVMAANDFVLGQQDEAASLKLQLAEQDAELARSMHEKEEQQAQQRNGLGLSESEVADVLGAQDCSRTQRRVSNNSHAGERKSTAGSSSANSLCPSPPNGLLQGNGAGGEMDAWRMRSVQRIAGAALQHSSAALATLELEQQAQGATGRHLMCPGLYVDVEREHGVWQEVEANRNARQVAILTKWFGTDVDRGLLIDVVNTCGGNLEYARHQLRALGLQEVEQQGSPAAQLPVKPPSPPSPGSATKRLQQQQQQQQRLGYSGSHSTFYLRTQSGPAAAVSAPFYNLATAAAEQRLRAAVEQRGRLADDCRSQGSSSGSSSLGELCAAEEEEADLNAMFEREWAAMLASGTVCSKDDLHARTEVMYHVLRKEADRLHKQRRSAQAAAQRADRKGHAHKALEWWQRVEHLKAKCCAASTQAAEKLHAWRNASRVSHLEWDFHCLHVDEALPMLQRNIDAAAILPGRKEVRVITGRGVHSDGEPKLLSAVREWLIQRGLQFYEHIGYFTVLLDPVNPTSVSAVFGGNATV